jgi:hypothetical protein
MLILVVILAIVFTFTYKRYKGEYYRIKKKKETHKTILNTFFSEAIKKGYTRKEIKKLLFKKGWPEKIVNEYCNKAFGYIEGRIKSKK